MLQSMTGYGKSVCDTSTISYSIEIKSLNSKQLDINTRIPVFFKEKELEIRNEISKKLMRGKVDLYIEYENLEENPQVIINKSIVSAYYKQMLEIANELNINDKENLLASVLRLPDSLKKDKQELDEKTWSQLFNSIREAMDSVIRFRIQEGEIMHKDISDRIGLILEKLNSIEQHEPNRINTIRNRMQNNIQEYFNNEKIDRDRFEQEIIFYIEKLDITEEKIRLKNHCEYFLNTMENEEYPGKKLNFISQEILREINTLGSKANDYNIQCLIVEMKDELEKIKEQISNVL